MIANPVTAPDGYKGQAATHAAGPGIGKQKGVGNDPTHQPHNGHQSSDRWPSFVSREGDAMTDAGACRPRCCWTPYGHSAAATECECHKEDRWLTN